MDSNVQKLLQIVVKLREDAKAFRDKANELDEYASRLKISASLLDEESAKQVLLGLLEISPRLLPS